MVRASIISAPAAHDQRAFFKFSWKRKVLAPTLKLFFFSYWQIIFFAKI